MPMVCFNDGGVPSSDRVYTCILNRQTDFLIVKCKTLFKTSRCSAGLRTRFIISGILGLQVVGNNLT